MDWVFFVEVLLYVFMLLVLFDVDVLGILVVVLCYCVINFVLVLVRVMIVGSVLYIVGWGMFGLDVLWGMCVMQIVCWCDDGDVCGFDFGIDLFEGDFGYGIFSFIMMDVEIMVKLQWVISYWFDGVWLFWNDFIDDGFLLVEECFMFEDCLCGLFVEFDVDLEVVFFSEDEMFVKLLCLCIGLFGIVYVFVLGESCDFEFVLFWSFFNW